MRGFFKRLGEIWSIFGITLLLLIFIELFFRIYMSYNSTGDPRARADCYQKADWAEDYYSEFARCNESRWKPYAYWKRKAFDGAFIQVDETGIRKTLTKSHPLADKQPPTTLFFFGGSAMWGTGVRDSHTIPSLTGNELIRQGLNPAITNFGESGYVSSQEVVLLITEIKKGNVPDIAVFYDGINDVFSSYQSGRAGIPQNEWNREQEFNTLKEKKKAMKVFFHSLKTLSTVQFLSSKFGSDTLLFSSKDFSDPELLAAQTVQSYNANIRLVNALAREYGFQAFFYWQPTLFDKPFQTAYEQTEMKKAKHIKMLLEEVNGLLFAKDVNHENIHFVNLSGMFHSSHDPLFIDWCHVGENGNMEISQRIATDILSLSDTLQAPKNPHHD